MLEHVTHSDLVVKEGPTLEDDRRFRNLLRNITDQLFDGHGLADVHYKVVFLEH